MNVYLLIRCISTGVQQSFGSQLYRKEENTLLFNIALDPEERRLVQKYFAERSFSFKISFVLFWYTLVVSKLRAVHRVAVSNNIKYSLYELNVHWSTFPCEYSTEFCSAPLNSDIRRHLNSAAKHAEAEIWWRPT